MYQIRKSKHNKERKKNRQPWIEPGSPGQKFTILDIFHRNPRFEVKNPKNGFKTNYLFLNHKGVSINF